MARRYDTTRTCISPMPATEPYGVRSMRVVRTVVLLLLAAFCLFGFLASGEPGPNHQYFRIGYAIVGIACAASAIAMIRRGSY